MGLRPAGAAGPLTGEEDAGTGACGPGVAGWPFGDTEDSAPHSLGLQRITYERLAGNQSSQRNKRTPPGVMASPLEQEVAQMHNSGHSLLADSLPAQCWDAVPMRAPLAAHPADPRPTSDLCISQPRPPQAQIPQPEEASNFRFLQC